MATEPVRNPASVEAAFAAVPEAQIAEIVDGELVVSPRPTPRHGRVAVRIARALGGFDRDGGGGGESDRPGGWILLPEPEIHFGPGPDKLVPDLAGWRRERAAPENFERAAVTLVPDWVCEILSDRTEAMDRGLKRRIYRRERVGFLWLVDPRVQTLEVYQLEGGRWVEVETFTGDGTVRAVPFEAVEIDLASWWHW